MRKLSFLLVLLGVLSVPLTAQELSLLRTAPDVLAAIEEGKQVVSLAKEFRTVEEATFKSMDPLFRQRLTRMSTDLKKATEPVVSAVGKSESLSGSVTGSVEQQEHILALRREITATLYEWGQLVDDFQATQKWHQHISLELSPVVNDNKKFKESFHIAAKSPRFGTTGRFIEAGDGTLVVPGAIRVAQKLQEIGESLDQTVKNLGKPEEIAQWFYLRSNLATAIEEYMAAQGAILLRTNEGLFTSAATKERNAFILRNRNTSVANMTFHSIKLAQFMQAHPELCPGGATQYEQFLERNKSYDFMWDFRGLWLEMNPPVRQRTGPTRITI